jgi:acyl-CoA thioesterase I
MRVVAAGLVLAACCAAGVWLALAGKGETVAQDIPLPERVLPGHGLRIVALGTSLTNNGAWPEAVAQRLTACLGAKVEVRPIAKAGANSSWGLAQVGSVAATAPDLVLIEFAVNDADLLDGTSLGRSVDNLRAIITGLRAAQPEAALVLMSTNPARGLRGWQRPFLNRYFGAARAEALAKGAGFFDGRARWQGDLRPGDLPDGLHPTAMAESRVIAPALAAYLARPFGRNCP